ncbi:MAG: hypothetical protein ABIH20_04930 [Candidatus Diapherotrites archaeon]
MGRKKPNPNLVSLRGDGRARKVPRPVARHMVKRVEADHANILGAVELLAKEIEQRQKHPIRTKIRNAAVRTGKALSWRRKKEKNK